MNCKNCGSELQEGMKFCNYCGTAVETQPQPAEQPAYTQPINVDTEPRPAYTAPQSAAGYLGTIPPSQVLTWGILGLAFATTTGIPGIIFSIIGKKKAAQYTAAGNPLTGPAKAGSIMAKIGLVLGIVMTAYYTLCFIGGFVAGMMETLG